MTPRYLNTTLVRLVAAVVLDALRCGWCLGWHDVATCADKRRRGAL